MIPQRLLDGVVPILRAEGRLVLLPPEKEIVFVGDTHGDCEATESVLSRFLSPDRVVVFLGDYVDRGADSEGNLRLLLETKRRLPDQIVLLMGNHEGHAVAPFAPADFWECLPAAARRSLGAALLVLPLAAYSPRGLAGLHGALPDAPDLAAMRAVSPGSREWRAMTWGDYVDLGAADLHALSPSRPAFGRAAFESALARLGLRALVRSHQPAAPTYLFDNRCLTVFTSSAYGRTERQVARLSPRGEVRDARDLELLAI